MNFKLLAYSCLRIISVVFIVYCIFSIVLYFIQEKLIFFPQALDKIRMKEIMKNCKTLEDIEIKTNDGIIRGWIVKNGNPVLIYFGGNAEEVSHMIEKAAWFKGWSVVLMNYRGYGLSNGKPSEKNLFADSLLLYDNIFKRKDIDNNMIIVMGRSLGTGVAVYVAQKRKVNGVILVSPYDSVTSIAYEQFPFVPISLILKHKFDSISRAPDIKAPMLSLIAGDDITIKPWHSKKLIEKWGGRHSTVILDGNDHNSILHSGLYWEKINEFLHEQQ